MRPKPACGLDRVKQISRVSGIIMHPVRLKRRNYCLAAVPIAVWPSRRAVLSRARRRASHRASARL
eukprot:5284590-Alexandrium_andersonii.AAC.1